MPDRPNRFHSLYLPSSGSLLLSRVGSLRRWRLPLLLAAIYFAVLVSVNLADRLVLFPSTFSINSGAAKRTAIPFQSGELEIWTAQSDIAQRGGRVDAYVLRFYGNADRADRWVAMEANEWDNRAVEVWGVNYPGYGGSTGPARLAAIGPAALAAYDALKAVAGDRPIVLFGASIGTTPALHVAAQREISGAILHNPPPLRQMILRQFGWWNLWLLAGPVAMQIPRELDSIANAKAARAPAIFLLAEEDEVIAPRFQQLVVDAYAGEKRIIPLAGASHNSPVEGAATADLNRALEWLLPRRAD